MDNARINVEEGSLQTDNAFYLHAYTETLNGNYITVLGVENHGSL